MYRGAGSGRPARGQPWQAKVCAHWSRCAAGWLLLAGVLRLACVDPFAALWWRRWGSGEGLLLGWCTTMARCLPAVPLVRMHIKRSARRQAGGLPRSLPPFLPFLSAAASPAAASLPALPTLPPPAHLYTSMGSDSWWILVLHAALHCVHRTAPTFFSRSISQPTLLSALQKGQAKVVSSLGRCFLGGALALLFRLPICRRRCFCCRCWPALKLDGFQAGRLSICPTSSLPA